MFFLIIQRNLNLCLFACLVIFQGFTIRNTRVHHMSERANENTVEHHWTFCRRTHRVNDWQTNSWMDLLTQRRCDQGGGSRQAETYWCYMFCTMCYAWIIPSPSASMLATCGTLSYTFALSYTCTIVRYIDSPPVTVVNSGLPSLVNSLCWALYCFNTTTPPCTKPERNVFSRFGVEELDWPAQNLNSIQHLWRELEWWLWASPSPNISFGSHWCSCGWMGENPCSQFNIW